MNFEMVLTKKQGSLKSVSERLAAYSPLATLKRGYSLVYQNGNLLRSREEIDYEKELSIKFAESEAKAKPLKN